MNPTGCVVIPLGFPLRPDTPDTYIFRELNAATVPEILCNIFAPFDQGFEVRITPNPGPPPTLTITRSGYPPPDATAQWIADCISDLAVNHSV